MKNTKRFTLRKEYFGGLVHDAKTMHCHTFGNEMYVNLELMAREPSAHLFCIHASQEALRLWGEYRVRCDYQSSQTCEGKTAKPT